MADDMKDKPYVDEKGQLIGGVTAHATGIGERADLEALQGPTSAEEAADALKAAGRDPSAGATEFSEGRLNVAGGSAPRRSDDLTS